MGAGMAHTAQCCCRLRHAAGRSRLCLPDSVLKYSTLGVILKNSFSSVFFLFVSLSYRHWRATPP